MTCRGGYGRLDQKNRGKAVVALLEDHGSRSHAALKSAIACSRFAA